MVALLLVTATPVAASSDAAYGSHIVTYILDAQISFTDKTAILAIEDLGGNLMVLVTVHDGRLRISDGDLDTWIMAASDFDGDPDRLDVLLHGATYSLLINEGDPVTARTITPGTQGAPSASPGDYLARPGSPFTVAGVRVDDSNMAYDTSMLRPIAETGWEPIVSPGSLREPFTQNSDGPGYHSTGHLVIAHQPGVAYLRAPAPAGPYFAEGVIKMTNSLHMPLGGAALAAVSGDPDNPSIHWSIVFDRALDGTIGNALWFHSASGLATQLAPGTMSTRWWDAKVHVDGAAVEVTIDDQYTTTFHEPTTKDATHIAAGDVFILDVDRLPTSVTRHDNLAVFTRAA